MRGDLIGPRGGQTISGGGLTGFGRGLTVARCRLQGPTMAI
jgi:hypothetical protein